jgi:NAD(P)-dependent dehydrogenase (short-subunit alcohol dehydrogenase family)
LRAFPEYQPLQTSTLLDRKSAIIQSEEALQTIDESVSRAQGKVVIITGTNSPLGIGRATAHQFANNKARAIFICDFNTQHLETHKRELNSLYPDVAIHTSKVDAGDEADVKRVVDEALEKYGRLDVFFANVSIDLQHILTST